MLSVVIPACNEEANIGRCIDELLAVVQQQGIRCEIIVVNDNSTDGTADVVQARQVASGRIRLVHRRPPGGFGRAVRDGIRHVRGDIVVIYMADLSDDPRDVVTYYQKIVAGYDCVFGSRFMRGSHVEKYPPLKRLVNRVVNRTVQLMFCTRFNDLSNAFKAYRTSVIRDCGPYRASHFNITLEMSLSALIRRYRIAQVPIRWYGRTWGSSKLKLREMGRKYLCTTLMLFFQRMLISDDLMAERLAGHSEVDWHRDGYDPEPSPEQLLDQLESITEEIAVLNEPSASQQPTPSNDLPAETC